MKLKKVDYYFIVPLSIIILLAIYINGFPWNSEYYPHSLNKDDVHITYADDRTIIIIDKKLEHMPFLCTESMRPYMGCENTVLVEPIDENTIIQAGDIIRYKDGERNVLHQFVGTQGDCYRFKGFNDILIDDCVERDELTHRLVTVITTKG